MFNCNENRIEITGRSHTFMLKLNKSRNRDNFYGILINKKRIVGVVVVVTRGKIFWLK